MTALAQAPSPPPAPPHETFFYSHDGLRLEAYFYRPAGDGPFPLVVYNHGSRAGEERSEWPVGFIGRLLPPEGYAVLVPERRGYGKSEGTTFTEEIGQDRGQRFVARLAAEAGDLLAAADHVTRDPAFRVDARRRAVMGWSFGGIVTTLAASGRSDFRAAIVQAPGSLNWDRSPDLRAALIAAARKITLPTQCLVAENDRTTESARAICAAVTGAPKELKVYAPFTAAGAQPREGGAPGHMLFGALGVSVWKADVLAFLEKHLAPSDGKTR